MASVCGLHPDGPYASGADESARDDLVSSLSHPDAPGRDFHGHGGAYGVSIQVTPPKLRQQGLTTSGAQGARVGGVSQVV